MINVKNRAMHKKQLNWNLAAKKNNTYSLYRDTNDERIAFGHRGN